MALYDLKRVTFENAVKRISKRRGLNPPPGVSITERPCSGFHGEIAHIHVKERIICIWKKKLEELNLDEIEKVAAHEVAHLISEKHGAEHMQAQAELEIANWAKTVGGAVIDGSGKVDTTQSKEHTEPRRRRKICSFSSCETKKSLAFCPHCEKFFCPEHIEPKVPWLFNPKVRGMAGELLMENWRKQGHPCPDYYSNMKKKDREELERRWEALSNMNRQPGARSSGSLQTGGTIDKYLSAEVDDKEVAEPATDQKQIIEDLETEKRVDNKELPTTKKANRLLVVVFGILVIILLVLIFLISTGMAR